MKRLAVYFAVLVGCLFVGLTTYYMVKNYEIIDISASDSSLDAIYLNVGETTQLEITHDLKQTELAYSIENQEIISFNIETGEIIGLSGGETKLTITTENTKYGDNGKFEFTVKVGDGSEGTPIYILSEEDLRAIGGVRDYGNGKTVNWSASAFYQIKKDIFLTEEWVPLCSENGFSGTLQGELKTIHNMTITQNHAAAGLFAMISDLAVVDSIVFESPSLTGRFDAVGVVAGISEASTISKIEVRNGKILAAPYEIDAKTGYSFVGGIVGASVGSYAGQDTDGTKLVDRGVVTMSSFQGTIGTLETITDVINPELVDLAIMDFGGIAGYVLGSTIHNTKAEVNFNINSEIAQKSTEFNREQAVLKGICVDLGGIVGAIDGKNEVEGITIYPIIKDNLAIVEIDNKTTTSRGVVGHIPLDVHFSGTINGRGQWVLGNYYYTSGNIIVEGGSIVAYATTRVTEGELRNPKTFITMPGEPWLMGSVLSPWTMNENEAPKINFLGLEVPATIDQSVYEISSEEDFFKYYEKMTSQDISDLTRKYWLRQSYKLTADIELANIAGITAFNPIGGGKFMFSGKFDGNGHTITFCEDKNLNLAEEATEFSGLFGQVGPNAEIKNLTVVGISIKNSVYAGAIAGVNYGKITNCVVKDLTIENAIYNGGFTGVNYGTISSTLDSNMGVTDLSFVNNISITNTTRKTFAGAIAGINHGTIDGIKIPGDFKISAETATDINATRYLGGLAGYNTGVLNDCFIVNVNISDHSTISVYMGGFAGINSGKISLCSVGLGVGELSSSINGSMEAGNQIAGGFAGMITETGSVTKSFANITINNRTVGGFAAYMLGVVSESYNNGMFTGHEVGGFAVHMALTESSKTGGKIVDCYTIATLSGADANSKVAGLSVYMRHPALIEKCYMAASFVGEGQNYYESFTNTREGFVNWVTSWARPNQKLGTINKVVINTTPSSETENSTVNKTSAIISYNGQVVQYLTEEECKTNSSVYETLGFTISSSNGWTIEAGQTPILTSIEGLHGVYQNPANKPIEE